MSVAIRLSRVGTKHVPFFRVVVVDSRKKRDGKVIEIIGTYDALKTKLVNFKADRFDDWVSKGAQPSDSAKKVYKLNKLQQSGKLPEKEVKVVKAVEEPKKAKAEVKTEDKAPVQAQSSEPVAEAKKEEVSEPASEKTTE